MQVSDTSTTSPRPEKVKPGSALTYTVDSFARGIAFGQHRMEKGSDPRDFYSLHLEDDTELLRLRSRYSLHKQEPLVELESHLVRLSKQGVLRTSAIYLGTTTDPFLPFEEKFDASMRFLELFQRYTPGLLTVQTRSPLVVIAMPVLKRLGKNAAVTIGIETPSEEMAQRYTPCLPRVEERLKTVRALRNLGIEVTIQVGPVLPYGEWRKDAQAFAELLANNADYIYVRPLTDGSERAERRVKWSALGRKLSDDRKFHWLRPDTATPLISALEKIAPEKLKVPVRAQLQSRQMDMFAA